MPSHLRLATEQDGEEIAAIYRPIVESTATSFETEPPTVGEVRARIDKTLIAYPWLVCELRGRVARRRWRPGLKRS
jgi:L-amino acid N-acyltransferase YncA